MIKPYNARSVSNKVVRCGKYLIPIGSFFPQLRYSPAPSRQQGLDELHLACPGKVKSSLVGHEPYHPQDRFRVFDKGQIRFVPLRPVASLPVTVHTIKQGATVGRCCCLIGPNGSAIRETGFNLDPTPSKRFGLRKLDPKYWHRRHRGDLTSRLRLPGREHFHGRIIVLNNRASHNFYHWMVESIPRLAACELAGIDVDGIVVDHQQGYQKEVLEMLGIPKEKWIQPHCRLHLSADELLWVSDPGETLLRHFVRMLEPEIQSIANPSLQRRIYISRRKAGHRRLQNDDELQSLLEPLGFESYCFEDLTFKKQCTLLRESKLVVTVHGAALANAMFCSPGTSIVEIFPERRLNIDLFSNWSRIYGLDHQTVMCSCTKFRQRLNVSIDDVLAAVHSSQAMNPERFASDLLERQRL